MRVVSLFIIALIIVFGTFSDTDAIPAFARKYSMSCKTCHAPFPRLKEAGDEFAGDGFIFKDQENPRYYKDTGDEELSLIRDVPIAFRFEGWGQYRSDTDREVDLSAPWLLKILSGGELTKDVAYYFYFFFSERGEVAGVEDAFLMFNDVFNTEIDLYAGQFQASDPLFKRELRLSFEDYQIYRARPGESSMNLTYDRGLMLTYTAPTETDIIVEILNGNGIGEADDQRVYDKDKYKSYLGRISQSIAEPLRIGGFAYWGKEIDTHHNEVTMAGPDLTVSFSDKLEFNAQYLWRKDTDPFFQCNPDNETIIQGGMGELIFTPNGDKSKWYGVLLYNDVQTEYGEWDLERYQTASAGAGYMLRTNIRLAVEFTHDLENEENRAVAGFIAAF